MMNDCSRASAYSQGEVNLVLQSLQLMEYKNLVDFLQ